MVYFRGWGPSRASWFVFGSAACVAGLNVEACSSPFSNCEAARDCPIVAGSAGQAGNAGQAGSPDAPIGQAGADAGNGDSSGGAAGEGGAASEGGAGGQAPTPECTTDADCTDHLACNGVETCEAGTCVPGTAPCANPDPAHCDAVCKELDGAASCSVRGQDKDKDGHFSSACLTMPGDDCNDAVASIYTGATEVCDGIDHNCNGKIGLSDGFLLSGKTVDIGPNTAGGERTTPAIAWATDKSVYGIVYGDISSNPTADLYFETVSLSGAVTLPPVPFNTGLLSQGGRISFTWGGDRFGVSWSTGDLSKLYFNTLSSTGVTGTLFDLDHNSSYASSLGLARIPGGNWAVLYSHTEGSSLWAHLVPATGTTASDEIAIANNETADTVGIAASSSKFVIGNTPQGGNAAASIWSSTLTSPAALKATGSVAVVGSGPKGFAIATTPVAAGGVPQFYAFGPTGAALCGPVNLADKNFVPAAIAGTDNGYLVVSSGVLRAQEVHADCTLGALFTVDPNRTAYVGVAGSAAGYGVVWQDVTDNIPRRRLFGPHFCD